MHLASRTMTDIRLSRFRYQVGLYDVRFSVDSIFERVAKAVQFLVMIGFAIVGPKYNVGKNDEATGDEEVVDGAQPSLGYYFVRTFSLYTYYCLLTRCTESIDSIPHGFPTGTCLPVQSINVAYTPVPADYLANVAHCSNLLRCSDGVS